MTFGYAIGISSQFSPIMVSSSGVASPFELGGTADLNFRHVTMGFRSRDTTWSKPPATTISLIFDNANYGQNILRTRVERR